MSSTSHSARKYECESICTRPPARARPNDAHAAEELCAPAGRAAGVADRQACMKKSSSPSSSSASARAYVGPAEPQQPTAALVRHGLCSNERFAVGRICAGTDWAHPCPHPAHICAGTDWAHPCPHPAHICTGTGLAAATSAPRLGLSCPHLHRDCAHLGLGSQLSECVRPSERTLLRCARRCNSPRHDATCYTGVACRSTVGLCTPCDSFVDMRVTRNLSRRTRTLGIIHSAMAAAYSSTTPSGRRRRAAVHAHACDGT